MAARVNKTKHDQSTVERIRATIQTGQLIKRLSDHINGVVELTPTQVSAANILLKKCLPDLVASENKTEVTHNYVARVPAVAKDMDTWLKSHGETLKHPTTIQ